MKQIRKRLTYANVMSSLAVFLILGGATAVAAKKIGSNEIKANSIKTGKIVKEAVTTSKLKKNAVTTAKIADDAVTGDKVKESTLGEVPSAASAKNANSATNATSADSVGGLTLRPVTLIDTGSGNVSERQILNLGGLLLFGSCSAGLETVEAESTVAGAEISSIGFDAATEAISFGASSDNLNPGARVSLINPTTPNNDVYQIVYQGGGKAVTVQLSTEGPTNPTCEIGGTAIG